MTYENNSKGLVITTRKNLNYSKACQTYQKVIEEAFLKVEEYFSYGETCEEV